MTRWEPRSLVAFAIEAGWHGDALIEAVASAWAASRGDDAATTGQPLPASPKWAGLWQIPLGANTPDADRAALLNPATNAAVAYEMWRKLGGFAWLPPLTQNAMYWANLVAVKAVELGPGATLLPGAHTSAEDARSSRAASDMAGRASATVDATARLGRQSAR